MKNALKLLSVFLVMLIAFTGCLNNTPEYNNDPYKYIVLSSFVDSKTNLIKIGMNDNIIQSYTSNKNSITMGAFMRNPQNENGKIYYAASSSRDMNIDYGILSIEPHTLSVNPVPGLAAATSFYVDGDNVYTAYAIPGKSVLAKSKITDSQKNADKFLSVNLQGIVDYIFEDDGYIYTTAEEDLTIMSDALTVTKIDKETLKVLDKFIIKDSLGCSDVLATQTDIYFVIKMSTEATKTRKAEKFDGYTTDERYTDLSEIYRLNKKTKELSVINLPFANADNIGLTEEYLYVISGRGQNKENDSIAKINIKTNKIEKAINLPYCCLASHITDNMFITLDGYNLYEYDLKSMNLLNTIKLTDKKSDIYNAFALAAE